MTTSAIETIKTANYVLTFNNDVLVSAKDLITGRFVKRSIALAEYQSDFIMACEAVKSLSSQAVKTSVISATKILLSASVITTLTILFALSFVGAYVAFIGATSGNIYAKGLLLTIITCASLGGLSLCLIDQFNSVKKQLKAIC